jgi:hypothetical protein
MCSEHNKSQERPVLGEEQLDDIGNRLEANPKKLLRLSVLQCGLSKSRAHTDTKLLKKLWPYRTTVVPPDCEVRIRY